MASTESTKEIACKTVSGLLYSGGAAIITFILGFLRAVLLARLLMPEHFGVITIVFFFAGISTLFKNFGLDSAIIHCQENAETLKRTYFSLRFGLNALVTAILIIAAPIIQNWYPQFPQLGDALIVISIVSFIKTLNMIQITFIRKEMAFSSLALAEVISSVAMTIIAPYVAWLGWGLWALVAERATDVLTRFIFTWGPFRQWRPRFGWDRRAGNFFWQFGKPTWIKMTLEYILDRFDDFWVGSALGQVPLGYYNKAYDFACAPRRVFALPLLKVFIPVFARLQQDREQLSKAFSRSAFLIIRMVFFGAGLFSLVLPEFIDLVIGVKWLPMLWTFRLLLGYAVFDSFLGLIHGLFGAIGKPVFLRNATLKQAIFFLPAVVLGAHTAGFEGVAIASDGMLLIGICCLYHPLKETVDFSIKQLLGWPTLALIFALGLGGFIESVMDVTVWKFVFIKTGVFTLVFGGILALMELKDYLSDLYDLWEILKRSILA